MGAERVLFASGAPYLDQRYEVKRVLWADVDDTARRAMQCGNAQRLLGLDT
jgi:predicted TIM-barrel fold metal-dependent hydrolase